MKIALRAKNKLGCVDGTVRCPTDKSSNEFLQWNFVDSTIISWIINSMSKELFEAYIYIYSFETCSMDRAC